MKQRQRLISWVILMVFSFTLIVPITPALAAGSISLNPSSVTVGYSSPVNVTATATGTTFDDVTLVQLYQNGVLQEGKILGSSVAGPTSASFQIATGLAAGTYVVRISGPSNPSGVSANFTVNAPSVSISPSSAPEGYTAAVSVTATGSNTSFSNGNTSVKLYSGDTEVTGAITDLAVTNTTSLSFNIATGRAAGTYSVKITTGTEVVQTTFTVYPVSISLSPSSIPVGYASAETITVTGSATKFIQGSSKVTILEDGQPVTNGVLNDTETVTSDTYMSFKLATGRSAKTYTVRIQTGSEQVTGTLTVYNPSVAVSPAQLPAGYGSAKTLTLTGTNTNFTSESSVTILDGSDNPVGGMLTGKTLNSSTGITIQLNTGLSAGAYKIRVNTGQEQVETPFTVYTPTVSFSPSQAAEGYSSVSVTAAGTNTNFVNGTTTVTLHDSNGNIQANKITGGSVSGQQVTFQVASGLGVGTYTIKVTTGEEVAQSSFEVKESNTLAKVSLLGDAQTIAAGSRTGPILVQRQNASGVAQSPSVTTDVYLATSNTGIGKFYSAASGGNPISQVTIGSGSTYAAFYYEDTKLGEATITASATSLESSTQKVTVTPGLPDHAVLTVTNATSTVDNKVYATVSLQDVYNNATVGDIAYNVTLTTNSLTGNFYPGVSETVYGNSYALQIPSGQSSVSFYYGDTAPGAKTLTAATSGMASVNQAVTFSSGALANFVIALDNYNVQPGDTVMAAVYAKDKYNNPATGYRGTINWTAATDAFADLPEDYVFQSADQGFKAFAVKFQTAGNQTVTVSDATYNKAKTSDPVSVALKVNAFNPDSGAIDVAPISLLTVTFNGTIDKVNDSVQAEVYEGSNALAGVSTSYSGSTLNINGVNIKDGNLTYTVIIPGNELKTAAGAVYANPISWSFTTKADGTAPGEVTNPQVTTGHSLLTVSWISSDPDVSVVEIAYKLTTASTYTVASTVNAATNTSSIINGLTNGSTYNIRLVAIDAAGNRSGSVFSSGTPQDMTPPAISLKSPDSGYTGVPITANVLIEFSKAMKSSTINNTNIRLLKASTPVPVLFSYDSSSKRVIMQPSNVLDNLTQYTVSVSDAVYDNFDQNVTPVGSRTWTFTTEPDTTAPAVITNIQLDASGSSGSILSWTNPADKDSLVVEVAYKLTADTVYTVLDTVSGSTYTITNLASGSTYDLRLVAIDAVANRSTAATKSVNMTAPSITSPTPAAGADQVLTTANVQFTFTKTMKESTINNTNIQLLKSGTVVPAGVSYNSTTRQITIQPTGALQNSTVYTVSVSAAVYDEINLSIPASARTWTFTTVAASSEGTLGAGTPVPTGTTDQKPSAEITATTALKTNADGTQTAESKISESEFNKIFDANTGAKEFVLEVKESAATKVAIVPAAAFSKLTERTANLVLKNESANLIIPGGVVKIDNLAKELGVDASKVEIKISVEEVKTAAADKAKESKEAGMKPVSKVLEFTMEAAANGKSVAIKSFGGKVIQGEFPYTAKETEGVKDKAKLSVFKFNENTGKWVYVRSKVADGKVVFFTPTFSKYTIMEYSKSFADVAKHWAKSDIELMASKLVVNGTSGDTFAPEAKVTRAEFAAMLVRALGLSTEDAAAGKFADVQSSDWFAADVAAANKAGLVQGFEDNTFKPNAQITRDQMAAMVVRGLKAAGKNISVSQSEQDSQLAKFADKAKLQAWAKADVAAAVKAGIVNGVTTNSFAPAAKATRAESATMLKRLMTTGDLI